MQRLAFIVVLAFMSGCGLEDYEARMTARLAALQEMTRYESLWGPTRIDTVVNEETVEYPITIRLPKAFGRTDWFRVDSEYRNTGKPPEPHVLYPPFLLEFPGFNRIGEGLAEGDTQTQYSFYCYLGVLESRDVKFDAVLADLRKKTAAKLPQTGPWQDVECHDENLVATTWKMFEAKGKQKFLQHSGLAEATLDADGTFRVYAREDQGYIVLWAVRVPDSLANQVFLLDLADAVAGTMKIIEPAPMEPLPPQTQKPKAKDAPDDTPGETPPGEMPPTDEAPATEKPAQENPAAKPKAADAPVDEEPWSDPSNDQAPTEPPAEEAPTGETPPEGEQPPAENAEPADMPEAAPMDEAAPGESTPGEGESEPPAPETSPEG